MNENTAVPIRDLFGNDVLARFTSKKEDTNPRGKRLKTIADKSGYHIGLVCKKLEGLHDIRTLDYIISTCNGEYDTHRVSSWKHAFDIEIKRVWNNKPV